MSARPVGFIGGFLDLGIQKDERQVELRIAIPLADLTAFLEAVGVPRPKCEKAPRVALIACGPTQYPQDEGYALGEAAIALLERLLARERRPLTPAARRRVAALQAALDGEARAFPAQTQET